MTIRNNSRPQGLHTEAYFSLSTIHSGFSSLKKKRYNILKFRNKIKRINIHILKDKGDQEGERYFKDFRITECLLGWVVGAYTLVYFMLYIYYVHICMKFFIINKNFSS